MPFSFSPTTRSARSNQLHWYCTIGKFNLARLFRCQFQKIFRFSKSARVLCSGHSLWQIGPSPPVPHHTPHQTDKNEWKFFKNFPSHDRIYKSRRHLNLLEILLCIKNEQHSIRNLIINPLNLVKKKFVDLSKLGVSICWKSQT